MSGAEILELTYFDLCNIKRKQKIKNQDTGITEDVEVVIAENIKCSVSKEKASKSLINGEIGSIVSTYKLFINPSADIQAGDTIEVTNQIAEKTIYLVGKPFYYVYHKEIPITEKDRV